MSDEVKIAYNVVEKSYRGPHGPDGLFYYPCKSIRRKVVNGWCKVHHLCHVCNKWYNRHDTGSIGGWHYCVNCKEDFQGFIEEKDPPLYESMRKMGIWRTWNR